MTLAEEEMIAIERAINNKKEDVPQTIDKVDTVEEESIKQEKDDQVSDQDKEN